MIEIIGVYTIEGQNDVHLIEMLVNAKYTDFDIGEFTQEQVGVDKSSWQVAWDEKYLNLQGTAIIGDWSKPPIEPTDLTRLTIFLHFIDFKMPLITPFGEIELKKPEKLPERLNGIIEYEQPD